MAKMWGTRPSQFLEIESNWVCYDFDAAVWSFGSYVEGQLDKVEQDAMEAKGKSPKGSEIGRKKSRRLRKLLGIEETQPKKKTSIYDVLAIGGTVIKKKD